VLVGAAGAVTLGVSIGVGANAKSTADDLRTSCAPACSSSQVSSVNTQLVVSDVLTGTGIALVGVAAILFFTRHPGHASRASPVRVTAAPGGLSLTY